MKKNIILLLIVSILALSACNAKQKQKDKVTNSDKNDKINVVASFFPAYDLVKKIGGEKVDVKNLTETGDSHSFEPSIKDMELISKSDLLVINGAGFEGWISKVKESQNNLNIVEMSKGLDLIKADENHNHDEHEDEHAHEGHNHGEYDPHTWLSVKNPIKMMENIKEALSKISPENKEYFESNYNKYKTDFEKLAKKYDESLSKYKGKSFIAPHAAFNYLLNEYKIEQIGIEGINSTDEPNPSRVKEIIDIMKEHKLKTVFHEFGKSDKTAKTIASEINGNVKPISTLEVITKKDIENGEDYISLLEMNLKNLIESFEGR